MSDNSEDANSTIASININSNNGNNAESVLSSLGNNNENVVNNAATVATAATAESNEEPAVPKAGDYVQLDVRGDGNCFYRALYNALKYHTIPGLLERFIRCIFEGDVIPAAAAANPGAITEDEFCTIVRNKLGKEILKEPGILEAQAANGLPAAAEPAQTMFEKLKNAAALKQNAKKSPEYKALYKEANDTAKVLRAIKKESKSSINSLTELTEDLKATLRSTKKSGKTGKRGSKDLRITYKETKAQLAALSRGLTAAETAAANAKDALQEYVEGIAIMWDGYIGNMPVQVQNHSLLGSPEAYEGMDKATFKKEIVKLLTKPSGGGWMYASDFDTYLLRFLMKRCANPIFIGLVPKDARNYEIKETTPEGHPIVHLFLIQDYVEHYNFVVREDVYKARLRSKKIVRVLSQAKFKPAGAVAAATAPASPSPNTKAAIAAALAEEGEELDENNISELSSLGNEEDSVSPGTKAAIAAVEKSEKQATIVQPVRASSRIEELRAKRAAADAEAAKAAAKAKAAASAPTNPPSNSASRLLKSIGKPPPRRKGGKRSDNCNRTRKLI